jgi:mycothiol synthase
MTTYQNRPYQGEADLDAISGLLAVCELEDRMGVARSAAELRVQFEDPSLDRGLDTRLWFSADQQIQGYAALDIAVLPEAHKIELTLRWRMHPMARVDFLDDEAITFAEARLAALVAQHGLPGHIESLARDIDLPRQFMLEWHGYQELRELWQMECPLQDPIMPPAWPAHLAGYTIRPLAAEQEAQAWIDLYNLSFIDHWNFVPMTLDEFWHRRRTSPGYRPDQDLVMVAPDGELVAFCWSLIDPDQVARGYKQALLHQIGTRRGHRRSGLGRAIIWEALRNLQAAGMSSVRLYVYTDNQNNASTLYSAVGFSKAFSLKTYTKIIAVPAQVANHA